MLIITGVFFLFFGRFFFLVGLFGVCLLPVLSSAQSEMTYLAHSCKACGYCINSWCLSDSRWPPQGRCHQVPQLSTSVSECSLCWLILKVRLGFKTTLNYSCTFLTFKNVSLHNSENFLAEEIFDLRKKSYSRLI